MDEINKLVKKAKRYLKIIMKRVKHYVQTNIMVLVFIFTNLINTIIIRGLTVGNFLSIKPVLADLSVLLFISAFVYFIKPKRQIIYLFIWSVIITAVCIINTIYYPLIPPSYNIYFIIIIFFCQ